MSHEHKYVDGKFSFLVPISMGGVILGPGWESILKDGPLKLLVGNARLPDFFIIGAMKCGTSTLHQLLAQHPDIFIPDGEPHLFSIDDFDSFPQAQWNGELVEQNLEAYWVAYSKWYSQMISDAGSEGYLGEDSAGYLSSPIAIERIATLLPKAKLLVVLRDPIARTYSHYWHWVRSGRALVSFEDSLRFGHGNLLQRSYYEEQLRFCYSLMAPEQIKVLVFEEFIRDQERSMEDVLSFLEIPNSISLTSGRHDNKGSFPGNLSLKLLENYLQRRRFGSSYSELLPRLASQAPRPPQGKWLSRAFQFLNPSKSKNPHKMRASTRRWLKSWLYRKNSGLPDLLGRDLRTVWPTFGED